MSRISGQQKSRRKICGRWPDKGRLNTAVLFDVDGTLAGPYRNGKRELRPTALSAIKMLSEHAPVFLWSIVEGNAERLVAEFPELLPNIAGCYSKEDFPLHLVDHPYCIDDELADPQVFPNYVIVDTYEGGPDSGILLEAADLVVRHILKTRL